MVIELNKNNEPLMFINTITKMNANIFNSSNDVSEFYDQLKSLELKHDSSVIKLTKLTLRDNTSYEGIITKCDDFKVYVKVNSIIKEENLNNIIKVEEIDI